MLEKSDKLVIQRQNEPDSLYASLARQCVYETRFVIKCGEGGIRTLGRLSSTPVFETGTIGHSVTSPNGNQRIIEFDRTLETACRLFQIDAAVADGLIRRWRARAFRGDRGSGLTARRQLGGGP